MGKRFKKVMSEVPGRKQKKKDRLAVLVAQNRLDEAVNLLRRHIIYQPTDANKRLLIQYLCQMKQYQDALEVYKSLGEMTIQDLLSLALVLFELKEWDTAREVLEEFREDEIALYHYMLALAYMRGQSALLLPPEISPIVRTCLERACQLPHCPLQAFLLLDSLTRFCQTLEEREALLRAALLAYPEASQPRFLLTEDFYHQRRYKEALDIVAPLVEHADPMREAIPYAVMAAWKSGYGEQALIYVSSLPYCPNQDDELGSAYVKGMILLSLGRIREAIPCYEQETKRPIFEAQFLGYFGCAHAYLLLGDHEQGLAAVRAGIDCWMALDVPLQGTGALDTESMVFGDIGPEELGVGACVKVVCERLLQDETGADPVLQGQLRYLLFMYYEERGQNHPELLLQAYHTFKHPSMSRALAEYFSQDGDQIQGVEHHLTYWVWLARRGMMFDELHEIELWYPYESESVTPTTRQIIHEVAWSHLYACENPDILLKVFLPFYQSFWYPMLVDGTMHREREAVAEYFRHLFPDAELPTYREVKAEE